MNWKKCDAAGPDLRGVSSLERQPEMKSIANISDVTVERVGEVILMRKLRRDERVSKCVIPALVFATAFVASFQYKSCWFFLLPVSAFCALMFLIYVMYDSGRILASYEEGMLKFDGFSIEGKFSFWEYEIHRSGYNYYRCYYGLRLLDCEKDIGLFELRAQSIPRSQVWRKFAELAECEFYHASHPPDCIRC
jgi:hypothetical protein